MCISNHRLLRELTAPLGNIRDEVKVLRGILSQCVEVSLSLCTMIHPNDDQSLTRSCQWFPLCRLVMDIHYVYDFRPTLRIRKDVTQAIKSVDARIGALLEVRRSSLVVVTVINSRSVLRVAST